MKTYIEPALVKHGDSTEIVKGSCGFGVENWSLDRTGARMANWRSWVNVGWIWVPVPTGERKIVMLQQCKANWRCSTGHLC